METTLGRFPRMKDVLAYLYSRLHFNALIRIPDTIHVETLHLNDDYNNEIQMGLLDMMVMYIGSEATIGGEPEDSSSFDDNAQENEKLVESIFQEIDVGNYNVVDTRIMKKSLMTLLSNYGLDYGALAAEIFKRKFRENKEFDEIMTTAVIGEMNEILKNGVKKNPKDIYCQYKIKHDDAGESLTTKDIEDEYNEYNITFGNEKSGHPILANLNIIETTHALNMLNYRNDVITNLEGYDVPYCDVGANSTKHLAQHRMNIHNCQPILGLKDATRYTEKALKINNMLINEKIDEKIFVDNLQNSTACCNLKAQNCPVKSPFLIFVHSGYDMTANEKLDILINKRAIKAVFVLKYDPKFLVEEKGVRVSDGIVWARTDYKGQYRREGNYITFGNMNDGSHNYAHKFRTYMDHFKTTFLARGDIKYLGEIMYERCGSVYITYTKLLSPQKVYISRDSIIQKLVSKNDFLVLNTWIIEDGERVHKLKRCRMVKKSFVVSKKFFDLTFNYVMNCDAHKSTISETRKAAKAYNTRTSTSGTDWVEPKFKLNAVDLEDVTVAIYTMALRKRSNTGDLLNIFTEDNKITKDGSLCDDLMAFVKKKYYDLMRNFSVYSRRYNYPITFDDIFSSMDFLTYINNVRLDSTDLRNPLMRVIEYDLADEASDNTNPAQLSLNKKMRIAKDALKLPENKMQFYGKIINGDNSWAEDYDIVKMSGKNNLCGFRMLAYNIHPKLCNEYFDDFLAILDDVYSIIRPSTVLKDAEAKNVDESMKTKIFEQSTLRYFCHVFGYSYRIVIKTNKVSLPLSVGVNNSDQYIYTVFENSNVGLGHYDVLVPKGKDVAVDKRFGYFVKGYLQLCFTGGKLEKTLFHKKKLLYSEQYNKLVKNDEMFPNRTALKIRELLYEVGEIKLNKVIEYGCGQGGSLCMFSKLYDCEIVGYTKDENEVKYVERKYVSGFDIMEETSVNVDADLVVFDAATGDHETDTDKILALKFIEMINFTELKKNGTRLLIKLVDCLNKDYIEQMRAKLLDKIKDFKMYYHKSTFMNPWATEMYVYVNYVKSNNYDSVVDKMLDNMMKPTVELNAALYTMCSRGGFKNEYQCLLMEDDDNIKQKITPHTAFLMLNDLVEKVKPEGKEIKNFLSNSVMDKSIKNKLFKNYSSLSDDHKLACYSTCFAMIYNKLKDLMVGLADYLQTHHFEEYYMTFLINNRVSMRSFKVNIVDISKSPMNYFEKVKADLSETDKDILSYMHGVAPGRVCRLKTNTDMLTNLQSYSNNTQRLKRLMLENSEKSDDDSQEDIVEIQPIPSAPPAAFYDEQSMVTETPEEMNSTDKVVKRKSVEIDEDIDISLYGMVNNSAVRLEVRKEHIAKAYDIILCREGGGLSDSVLYIRSLDEIGRYKSPGRKTGYLINIIEPSQIYGNSAKCIIDQLLKHDNYKYRFIVSDLTNYKAFRDVILKLNAKHVKELKPITKAVTGVDIPYRSDIRPKFVDDYNDLFLMEKNAIIEVLHNCKIISADVSQIYSSTYRRNEKAFKGNVKLLEKNFSATGENFSVYDNSLMRFAKPPKAPYKIFPTYAYDGHSFVVYNMRTKKYDTDERFLLLGDRTQLMTEMIINEKCKFDPKGFEPPVVFRTNGVAGCGKTSKLIELFSENTVYLTTTRASKDDVNGRLSKLVDFDLKTCVKTIDSALMHGCDKNKLLLVDESNMTHFGSIMLIAALSRALGVFCLGDIKQLPYVERNMFCSSVYNILEEVSVFHVNLVVSHRVPLDSCVMWAETYSSTGGILTSNEVDNSISTMRYTSVSAVVEQIKGLIRSLKQNERVFILTNTQEEKLTIMSYYGKTTDNVKIMTAHESEGSTCEYVYFLRTNTKPAEEIYKNPQYLMIGSTRHTYSFCYFSSLEDLYTKLIKANEQKMKTVNKSIYRAKRIEELKLPHQLSEMMKEIVLVGGRKRGGRKITRTATISMVEDENLSNLKLVIDARKDDEIFAFSRMELQRLINEADGAVSSRPYILYEDKPVCNVEIDNSIKLLNNNGIQDTPLLLCRPDYFVEHKLPNTPMMRNVNVSKPVAVLQECFNDWKPEAAYIDYKFDPINMASADLSIHVDGSYATEFGRSFNNDKSYGCLTNVLQTDMPPIRPDSERECLLGAVKRNLNVHSLSTTQNTDNLVLALVENFFKQIIPINKREMMSQYFETKIEMSESMLKYWIPTQKGKFDRSVDPDFPLSTYDRSKYDFLLKLKSKPNLEQNSQSTYAGLQTIACHPKAINVMVCPMFKILKERILSVLPDNIMIYTDCSPEEFEMELNDRNIIQHWEDNALEIDIGKFDKSQGEIFLKMEMEIYRLFGMPEEFLREWYASCIGTVLSSKKHGYRFYVDYQRKSGVGNTFIGNTLVTMMTVSALYDLKRMSFCLFAGDDSLLLSKHAFEDYSAECADAFNLESKFFKYKNRYFCSKFLIRVDDYIKFVPDPMKILVKLGRSDLVNWEHAEEYRQSLVDLLKSYYDSSIDNGLAAALLERYKVIGISALLEAICLLISDKEKFKTLFVHDENVILMKGPNRPSLDI